jgi:hypothetical protein
VEGDVSARDLLAAATPRPWRAVNLDPFAIYSGPADTYDACVVAVGGYDGMFCGGVEKDADAALIVAAVNEYEAHVALEDAVRAHPMAEEAFRDLLARLAEVRSTT